jgi:hypothetical protein
MGDWSGPSALSPSRVLIHRESTMESESWSARIADALHARWPDAGFDAAGRVRVRSGRGDIHIVTVHSKLRRDESPAFESVIRRVVDMVMEGARHDLEIVWASEKSI